MSSAAAAPYTIRGYYRAPERNLEAFTADGFYRTGDIVVEVPAAGQGRYFALADRIKDLVNPGWASRSSSTRSGSRSGPSCR